MIPKQYKHPTLIANSQMTANKDMVFRYKIFEKDTGREICIVLETDLHLFSFEPVVETEEQPQEDWIDNVLNRLSRAKNDIVSHQWHTYREDIRKAILLEMPKVAVGTDTSVNLDGLCDFLIDNGRGVIEQGHNREIFKEHIVKYIMPGVMVNEVLDQVRKYGSLCETVYSVKDSTQDVYNYHCEFRDRQLDHIKRMLFNKGGKSVDTPSKPNN